MPFLARTYKMFFQVFLLSTYTVFFSVQDYLKISLSQEQANEVYVDATIHQAGTPDATGSYADLYKVSKKHKHHHSQRLNKRYFSELSFTFTPSDYDIAPVYVTVHKQYYAYPQPVRTLPAGHASLRGPPAIS